MKYITHIKAIFSKIHIRHAFMVLIVFCSSIAIVMGTVALYLYTKMTIEDECQEYTETIFDGISDNISLVLNRIYSISQIMQSEDDIYSISIQDMPYEQKHSELSDMFNKIITKDSVVLAMDFIAYDGSKYHFGDENIKMQINDEYLAKFSSYQMLLADSVITYDGKYYCALGRTIYNYSTGIKYGEAIFYVNSSSFGDGLSASNQNVSQNYFFISIDDIIINCFGNNIDGKNIIGKKLYLPEEFIGYKTGKKNDYKIVNYSTDISLITNDFKITGIICDAWLFKTMNSIILGIIAGMVVIILLAIMMAGLLSRCLSRDIVILADRMEKINFEKKFEEDINEIKNENEVSLLYEKFNIMCTKIYELIKEINIKNEKQRVTEINLLQSQINPHFLYNTLDAISWKAKENDEYEIDDMIINLAKFLRLGLHNGKNIVKVYEELEHLKCYLQIEKERFPDLFDVRYEIDNNIVDYDMVKVVLQPIVENSIKHGFDNIDYKGLIVIKGYEEDESIIFEISDNGVGIKWDGDSKFPKSNSSNGGYGLYNIDRRLSIYYGCDYDFEFRSEIGQGTVVRFKIGKNIKKY